MARILCPRGGLKILLFFFIMLLSLGAYAALAPWANTQAKLYEMVLAEEQRIHAQDVVTIRVSGIAVIARNGDGCPQVDEYMVKAIVESVQLGVLKKGDMITIHYQDEYYLCPGPQTRNPRSLKSSENYSAYLSCSNNRCGLAGDAWSFHTKEEFNDEINQTIQEHESWNERRRK